MTRLTASWTEDHRAFQAPALSQEDFVYVWADGVHLKVRLDEAKACVLGMIGVRIDGSKQLIALAKGYRESAGSWADLLRDCERRAMHAPHLAVGDGALGFWKALRGGFPDTCEHRCWVHKTANIPDALPKPAQPAAKNAIADIFNVEDKDQAGRAIRAFERQYGAKYPKAVE